MNKLMFAGLVFLFHMGVVFASVDKVYITNAAMPGSISMCEINALTGQLESCENLFLEYLTTPLDIALHNNDAYIANSNYPAFITQCEVDNDGKLNACVLTDVPSYSGISLHQSDALYAYLSYGTSSVQKCKITQEGKLENHNCHDSGAGPIFLNGPMYITFQDVNHTDYAYIANGDFHKGASVIQCQLDASGNFKNCQDSGAGPYFDGAADIDFVFIAGQLYAYITQPGGAIAKCHVDQKNGLLNDCTHNSDAAHSPIGMTIKTIANQLYAYIVDGGFSAAASNSILQCAIHLSGDLDCQDSGVGAIFSNPFGVVML